MKEEKGLTHIYHLNEDHPVVKPLKKAYGIDLILSAHPKEAFVNADPNIISLALHGSYADGSFDEKSDVDILAITTSKRDVILPAIHGLEDKLDKEVNVTVFKLFEWRKMADKDDGHILLYGSGFR
jgi:predicted nucleotidyltransferase